MQHIGSIIVSVGEMWCLRPRQAIHSFGFTLTIIERVIDSETLSTSLSNQNDDEEPTTRPTRGAASRRMEHFSPQEPYPCCIPLRNWSREASASLNPHRLA